MRVAILSFWIFLGAVPAFADPGGVPNDGNGNGNGNEKHMAAPAPLIGFGIPSALMVGGVLLGANLFRRRRR
jgi:hypothetical protein